MLYLCIFAHLLMKVYFFHAACLLLSFNFLLSVVFFPVELSVSVQLMSMEGLCYYK